HLHLQALQLAFEPVQEIGDLRAARLHAREAKLAAELVGCFCERAPVAALPRDARRFQACRTTAHYQHTLRLGARREAVAAPFELSAGAGIDEAGKVIVARTPTPAHLLA